MSYPQLDPRDKETIKQQIKTMASYYVPEWSFSGEGVDVGEALVDIFAQMFVDTIASVNKLPYKNYLNFLNFIGLKLLTGSSAKGYVTVTLNQGAQPGVYIKTGTQLFVDPGPEIGQVLYETQHDLFAVDNEITGIFCTNELRNSIVKPYDPELQQPGESARLFDFASYDNLQRHILYLASADILNLQQGAQVEVEVRNRVRKLQETDLAGTLADKSLFRWSVLTEEGWSEISAVDHVGNRVALTVEQSVPVLPLEQQENRWLKCEFKNSGALPEIMVDQLGLAAKAENIQPELLINNDLQLENKNFLPFGENFAVYDDFYIACEEAFTKKGAHVQLSFDLAFKRYLPPLTGEEEAINWKLIMKESAFKKKEPDEITIQEVIWEYWNGNGWARLVFDEKMQGTFKPPGQDEREEVRRVQISFACPEDADSSFVDAHENYWLRARISKVNNAYKPNAVYISPFIEQLSIAYKYRSETRPPDTVLLEKDLALTPLGFSEKKEQVIFSSPGQPEIAAYLCLKNFIRGGPVTLYLGGERRKDQPSFPLSWQYLGVDQGRVKWLPLKASDETRMLTQSGLLTFIGKNNFARKKLFGQEGCWIRALNHDNTSDKLPLKELPEISSLHFNTVKVQQQESMPVEYFSIESQQPGKICQLVGENLVWLEVWVDERGRLTEREQFRLIDEGKHRVELTRDETGQVANVWVEWEAVDDLLLAGPEDRCFMGDLYSGRVYFGNGKNGKIPPAGESDTIKILYKTGKGKHGNAQTGEIKTFADAVPYVNQVFNAEPVLGGCSRESIQEALKRGPGLLKNQEMAVADEDLMSLVKQADSNIVRVKCLAHRDPNGVKQPGAITVAFLPVFYNSHFSYFDNIKEKVWEKIRSSAPCVVSFSDKTYVVEVSYLEINLDLKLVIADYNDYQYVLQAVEEKLRKFLDPISGNYDGSGWEIGSLPGREKLYNVVKMVDRISRLDSIHLTASLLTHQERQPVDLAAGADFPLSVPLCGEVNISIEVEPDI